MRTFFQSATVYRFASPIALAAVAALVGCQESRTYETNKPVIEDRTPGKETLGEQIEEGINDAADAVTPDRPIVDVDTPLGDVNVSEDPATGRKRVDVDAGRNE